MTSSTSGISATEGIGRRNSMIDLVARKTVLETQSLCFATTYFWFLMEAFEKIRESKVVAHADEFETSLYLHLAGDRVQMDKAVAENELTDLKNERVLRKRARRK